MGRAQRTLAVERAAPNDLMTLASDRGPVPMNIAAVLVLGSEGEGDLDLETLTALLAARIPGVPRLRQRLVQTPFGCGRPVWVDDPGFDITRHVSTTRLPDPGDWSALLEVAAEAVSERLDPARPLWRGRLVTGLAGGGPALVLVLHHVLADGIGGLAVLAALSDGPGPGPVAGRGAARPFPLPAPGPSALFREAWASRLRAVTRATRGVRRAVRGLGELGLAAGLPRAAPKTSLNRPTGPKRRLATVRVPLADVVDAAHRHGCTVNDVVLVAVTGALAALLAGRGEPVTELVVSVPISSRTAAEPGQLGNATGVLPLRVPTVGDDAERVAAVCALTRTHRNGSSAGGRGQSAGPLGVLFRGLAGVGLFQVFIDHQRLVNTFVSNVRGPARAVRLGGHLIASVVPVALVPGNVGVAFGILSYAGRLGVTLVADPDVVPDLDELTALLAARLGALV